MRQLHPQGVQTPSRISLIHDTVAANVAGRP
jgi:hypothetical protein